MNCFDFFCKAAWLRAQLAPFGLHDASLLPLAGFSAAAVCCLMAARYSLSPGFSASDRSLWMRCAAILLGLAINTQIHVEQTLIVWIRQMAEAGDWYSFRRPLQAIVLAVTGIACIPPLRHVWRTGNRSPTPTCVHLALSGMGIVLAMLVLRGVSLHQTDWLLSIHAAGFSVGRWLDLMGVALVICGAVWASIAPRKF